MSLHPSSANNAASGHGGGGGDDGRGGGGGKRPKPAPNDPNVGKDFDTEKERLRALLRAALELANMGYPPRQGDAGKMRNWVNGLRNSPSHIRASKFSPGARAVTEIFEMIAALGPVGFDWLVDFLNEYYNTSDD